MSFVWRHKLFFGALATLMLAGLGLTMYQHHLLAQLVPAYLSNTFRGHVTLDGVEVNLLTGVRIKNLEVWPGGIPKSGEAAAVQVPQVHIRCNLLKSLMLADRYVDVTLVGPRVTADLAVPVFDPATILGLYPVVRDGNVYASISVSEGRGLFTNVPGPLPRVDLAWSLTATLSPQGALHWTLPGQEDRFGFQLEGDLDLARRVGHARVTTASSHLAAHPIRLPSGWSISAPLEATATSPLAIVPRGASARDSRGGQGASGAMTVPFGPSFELRLVPSADVWTRACVVSHEGRGVRLVGVTARGRATPGGLVISEVTCPIPNAGSSPAILSATGEVPSWDVTRAQLNLKIGEVALASLPGAPAGWTGLVEGSAKLSADRPIEIQFASRSPASEYFKFDTAQGSLKVRGDLVWVDELKVTSEGGSGIATGVVDWSSRHFDFSSRFEKFPQSGFKKWMDGFDLTAGTYTGVLTGRASWDPFTSELWTFDFKVDRPRIAGEDGSSAVLVGRHEAGRLTVSRLDLDRPGVWDKARFTVETGNDGDRKVRGVIENARLQAFSTRLRGRADVGVAIGSRRGRRVQVIRGQLRDLALASTDIKFAAASFTLEDGEDGVPVLNLTDDHSFALTAKVPGAGLQMPRLETLLAKGLKGHIEVRDLGAATRLVGGHAESLIRGGTLSASWEAQGPVDGPTITVHGEELRARTEYGELASGDFDAAWSPVGLKIDGLEGTLAGRPFHLTGTLAQLGGLDLDVGVQGVPVTLPGTGGLSPESAGRSRDSGRVSGRLTASARIAGTVSAPRGQARIVVDDVTVSQESGPDLVARLEGKVALDRGILALSDGHLRCSGVDCTVSGKVPVVFDSTGPALGQGPLEGALRIPRSDAAALTVLLPGLVSRASGQVQADIRLSGTSSQPLVRGAVRLSAPTLKSPLLGPPLEDVELDVTFEDRSLTLKRFDARVMGGTIRGTGTLPLAATSQVTSDRHAMALSLQGSDLVYKEDGVELTGIRCDLKVAGSMTSPRIEGTLSPTKGLVTLPLPDEDHSTPGTGTVDVRLEIPSNLWVKSDQLDAEMKGTLRLVGRPGDLHPRGDLQTLRGNIFLQNRRIRISEGSIRFIKIAPEKEFKLNVLGAVPAKGRKEKDREREAPYVNLVGQTEAGGVRIFVEAKGFADATGLRLSVRSLPAMEEAQILSLLLTGRNSTGNLQGQEVSGVLTNQLASQVEHSLVGRPVENLVSKAFGFDDFRINSGLLNLGNRDDRVSPSVTMGKYLAPNVYVAADGALNSQNPFLQRVELDLKLDKDFAITVEKALSDSLGSGVFDRTTFSNISANETRVGLSKQLRW